MFQARNKAWALARRSGDLSDWLAFGQIRNKCTSSVRKAKSNFYVNGLDNADTNSKKFWKIINSRKHIHNCNVLHPHLNFGNCILTDTEEISTAFNKHFAEAGHLFDNLHLTNADSAVIQGRLPVMSNTSPSLLQSAADVPFHFSLTPFSISEVLSALSYIDTRKSVGEDNLDPFFLKVSAPLITEYIAYIFNLSIFSGLVPRVWKTAHVLLLHKRSR